MKIFLGFILLRDSLYKLKHFFFFYTQISSAFHAGEMFSGSENKSSRFPSHCTEITSVLVHGNVLLSTYAGFLYEVTFLKIVDSWFLMLVYKQYSQGRIWITCIVFIQKICHLWVFLAIFNSLLKPGNAFTLCWESILWSETRQVWTREDMHMECLCPDPTLLSILPATGSLLPQKPIWKKGLCESSLIHSWQSQWCVSKAPWVAVDNNLGASDWEVLSRSFPQELFALFCTCKLKSARGLLILLF